MAEQGGIDQGLRVISMLVSGLLFYGAIGWAIDYWLHTSWALPVGLILGMVLGIVLVIVKFGRSE